MSDKVIANKSDLVAIADAVRNKTGSTEKYNVSELSAAAVGVISSSEGGGTNVETCIIQMDSIGSPWSVYYVGLNENGPIMLEGDASYFNELEIVKNTFMIIYIATSDTPLSPDNCTGGAEYLIGYGVKAPDNWVGIFDEYIHIIKITGDGTIVGESL